MSLIADQYWASRAPVRFFKNFSAWRMFRRKVRNRRGKRRLTGDSGVGWHGQKGTNGGVEIDRKGIPAIRSDINRRSPIRLDEHNLDGRYESVRADLFGVSARLAAFFFFSGISRVPRKQLPIGHKSGLTSLCRLIYLYIYDTDDIYIYIYIYVCTIQTLKFSSCDGERTFYFVDLRRRRHLADLYFPPFSLRDRRALRSLISLFVPEGRPIVRETRRRSFHPEIV